MTLPIFAELRPSRLRISATVVRRLQRIEATTARRIATIANGIVHSCGLPWVMMPAVEIGFWKLPRSQPALCRAADFEMPSV